ncbi:MAG: vWA domain-containing protein [Nanobdellota archaeon]
MVQGNLDKESDKLDKQEEAEELSGSLSPNLEEDKLMRSVIESDEDAEDGRLLEESLNRGVGSFVPDMMFSKMVNNFNQAKQMYGERIIKEVSGYSPDYIESNGKVPEFQDELKSKIGQKIKSMQDKGLIDEDHKVTEKGVKLASLIMYVEEIEHLKAKGILGKKESDEKDMYGEKQDSKDFLKGDRYSDIDIRKSVKKALKRGHKKVNSEDLKVYERKSEGNVEIIYAIDASGSMKGKKLEMSKKAGMALAFKAIENKDKVGLIAFGDKVKAEKTPSSDFYSVIRDLAGVKASKETDFANCIKTSMNLFSKDKDFTKHLIFISDGVPTTGDDPKKEALNAIAEASYAGITVSMIGVEIDEDAEDFLRKASEIGKGKFQMAKEANDIDALILEDYFNFTG